MKTTLIGMMALASILWAGAMSMAYARQPDEIRHLRSDTWVATDALGRSLPGFEECGPPRAGKFVGIFYFTWLGAHSKQVYDISKILGADPDNSPWGPPGAFHFWSEPHFGYYLSNDEWVIRRHAQMLTDAGVDVIVCDVTNGFTYDENYLTVCRVFEEVRRTGRTTPQIAFLANSGSARVVRHLYERFYSQNLYRELWFLWQGKPLILAPEEGLSDELKGFFTIRRSWAWTDPRGWFGDGRDKWPWLDNYPQNPGWHESPQQPEQISVCAAQHPTSNIGRSFHDGKQPPPDQVRPEKGLCFAEQWRRALEVDPQFIFITGWNEWVAQRFLKGEQGGPGSLAGRPLKPGDSFFVDQYSQEFSRDIEPMRGGHGDNYYYQMIDGIRRFKGVRERPRASAPRTIRLDDGFEQWNDIGPEFPDDLGDTAHRDTPGWEGAGQYANTSGRNDFDLLKVARDDDHLYFFARTREPITPPEGEAWMLLLLNTDGDPGTGWEGYDFVVNRSRKDRSTAILERNVGGRWQWRSVLDIPFTVQGNQMHLAVPRAALGLGSEKGALRLDLKWADSVPASGNIRDFIDRGDTAPNGRFAYRYEE